MFAGDLGAALVGTAIGLLGDRIFGEVTERAAGFLGMKSSTPQQPTDLHQIDSLNDEDIGRLVEEGVDSLHGLAFVPTARLFFNTTYSLQCICDWQDQALLVKFLGPGKAQTLREKFLVRGSIDARMIARQLLGWQDHLTSKYALTEIALEGKEEVSKLLGFNSVMQMQLALLTIAEDEVIARLATYYNGAALSGEYVAVDSNKTSGLGAKEASTKFVGGLNSSGRGHNEVHGVAAASV